VANDLYSPVGMRETLSPPQRPEPYGPIQFLLDTLPSPGACWPRAKREAWLKAVGVLFDLVYVEKQSDVVQQPEPWWRSASPAQVVLSAQDSIKVLEALTGKKQLAVPPEDDLDHFMRTGEVRTPDPPAPSKKAVKSTKTKTKRKVVK